MSRWLHACCERCWFGDERQDVFRRDIPPDPRGKFYVMPTPMIDPDGNMPLEYCCFCGGLTIAGIYVRDDPSRLLCQGSHPLPD